MEVKIGFPFAYIPMENLLIDCHLVTGLIITLPIPERLTTHSLPLGLPDFITDDGMPHKYYDPSIFCPSVMSFVIYMVLM